MPREADSPTWTRSIITSPLWVRTGSPRQAPFPFVRQFRQASIRTGMSANKLCSGQHKHCLWSVCQKFGCLNTKIKLAKTCRLIKVKSQHSRLHYPQHKVSCYKWRKMAGVFTPRDFTQGALASLSIQISVRDADRMTSASVRVFACFR